MALKNKSEVSTIDNPEFINLTPSDLSPLISMCEIKVFYLGHNRNYSYINKETALKMAKTLRGTPIVAAYREEKEDFGDHGHVIHIEDGEVTFSCKTVPYGFVAPDSKVWFKNFTDTDEFGNQVERTYLMTTGYLWTGQFPELTKVIEEGQPHSMELDSASLEGHWSEDTSLGVEFFIINDATFSKLCILGDDVEPCYEGSSITSPQVSSNFSLQEFGQTLFTMMKELQETLDSKGGLDMSNDETQDFNLENEDNTSSEEFSENEEISTEETSIEEASLEETSTEEEEVVEENNDDDSIEEEGENKAEPTSSDEYSAEQFEKLNSELESLRAEVQELRDFKLNIENQRKQALIDKYFMLSDEDKKDIVEHMSEYSFDEIKAKLAIMYVEQNVDFDKVDGQSDDEPSPAVTFSLEEDVTTEQLTDLQRALRETR